MYCCGSGWSWPYRCRSTCTCCSVACGPACSRAGSPGTMCVTAKVTTLMPRSTSGREIKRRRRSRPIGRSGAQPVRVDGVDVHAVELEPLQVGADRQQVVHVAQEDVRGILDDDPLRLRVELHALRLVRLGRGVVQDGV